MRRLPAPAPIGLATAARWTAVFAFDAVLIAAVLLRFHLAPFLPGLVALAGGLCVAVIALVLAVCAFIAIWRKGVRGFGRAMTGFILALMLLAPAGYGIGLALATPALVDVSTDTDDPPPLTYAAAHRPPGANPVAFPADQAERQSRAYPQIQSMLMDIPVDDMRKLVLRLMQERRWQVVRVFNPAQELDEANRPEPGPDDFIEAVATSFLTGRVDDIVVRIGVRNDLTRVDMRSASRFGSRDFGANAGQVQQFMAELRNRAAVPDQASQ